jgi:pimeloyl-[acyl-carrier protein] methyl ester esterase
MDGAPKLVFMPGIDGTGISFEPLSPFLPVNAVVTVVRYPADRLLTFEETVECAYEQIPPDQDVVLAESFSGPVAVELIGSGRLSAKGLILSATFARTPRPGLMKLLKRLPIESILRIPFPDRWLNLIVGDRETAAVIIPLWKRVKSLVPSGVLAHRIRTVGQIDVRPFLQRLTTPCLYIQATRDRIVPPSSASDFARAIPGLVIRKIEGAHPILQVKPEVSAKIINEFIERVTNRRQV